MKFTIFILAAVVLLFGCSKPAEPAKFATATRWEYKSITVENDAYKWELNHTGEIVDQYATNSKAAPDYSSWEAARSFEGDFDLNESQALDQAGRDGWELVNAIPVIQTVPQLEDRVAGTRYDNIRTGKIVLIFKRPAR